MYKQALPSWRFRPSVQTKQRIIKTVELFFYFLVWLVKIVSSVLTAIGYILFISLVFITKNTWQLMPPLLRWLRFKSAPYLLNILRLTLKLIKASFLFIGRKIPVLELALRWLFKNIFLAFFYAFKGIYLVLATILKIIWYGFTIFFVKFLGFFGPKASYLYDNRAEIKVRANKQVKEYKLFLLWLAKPFLHFLPKKYEKKILPKTKKINQALSPVIGLSDFKHLLREPKQILLRRAIASWLVFFLVISTFGVASLTPLFNWLFRDRQPAYAATFTGAVKVSAGSTTLSTNGSWYTAMAYSGDGINGDAEAGTFNPIHPGPSATDGAAGALALGHVSVAATATYAAAQFIGFKPSDTGNLRGVQLILENLTITSLSNVDIVVELLSFPTASCTTSCTNYVTGTQGAYTYPSDTVVLRRAVKQFNQGLSGENLAPGQYGRGTFDFRFDPEVAVTAGAHYGFRIINMGAGTPVFGTWAANAPYGDFPTVNGTIRTIGANDIDLTNAPTINMPKVLAAHNGLTAAAMVAANSAAGVGLPTVRRTQNEHWTATYSSANANWTLTGTVSGTQTNKLTTPTTGGTGAAWVNDGVPFTTLTAASTASTVLCVASTSGFATNQTINLWDADTATVSLTVASVTNSHASCSDGPAIITTAATVVGFTPEKNASVAQAIWKNRIVQGAMTTLTADSAVSTRVCVASIDGFSAAVGTAASVQIWDNDTAPIVTHRIASTNASDGACPASGPSIILAANLTTAFTVAQGAMISEISANISNIGTPSDGDVLRFTSYNFTQNPIGLNSQLARTTSVVLAYAKSQALATSNTNYPFLSNRHIYFVAYGDANTTAPADGDIVIVGNGKSNADPYDSTNLTNDYTWLAKEQHVVSIDRSWDAALAYTGNYGAAIGDGAGTRGNFAAYSFNGGWVSAVITPGSKLTIADNTNKHYRLTIPGKIVLDSDAILAFGDSTDPLPASTHADIYFDNVSPAVSSNLGSDSAASTSLTVVSTTGFAPGDTIVIDDNDSPAITRIIAAIENSTTLTLTAAAVTGYTTAQSAFAAKGPQTELPTGSDRRAGVYTMTGLTGTGAGTQDNNRTGRVNIYGQGSDNFRTMKSDLAVDIDGNIDTGYLGNNSTDAGNTWVDVKDNVVGNWQPLDNIAVAGATNQVVDNNLSSVRMGGNDDASQFPVWTGLAGLGRNALPTSNMEVAEIGTVPITNVYNADYNGGSPLYSVNYATSTTWTLFGDGANSELNDAIYFGDQGTNMMYSLEANLGTLMNASAIFTWEFYNGAGWTAFTPRDAYKYQTRTGHTIPLSANTTRNSYTVSVTSGNQANFGVDQVVMIDDNDSSPIYRRISAVAAGVITFTEPVTADYTTAQSASISRLNGGQWKSFDPSNFFTENGNAPRRILSWTPYDLSGTPAKTTINGVNAYWVRVRISGFTSWTTSPVNQNTPIGMSGIERIDSGALNVSSGSQEAKISQITTGLSYDPNETFTLEYGNSPGWIETHKYSAAAIVPPSAPYVWHIQNGQLNINETNLTHLNIQNTNVDTTDYTMSGLVYMDMVADATSRRLGFLMRQSLDGNGYAALITKTNAANTVGFYTTLAGVPTVIGTPTSKAFSDSTWYCLKSQVSGTTLNVKFWATTDCNSGEPGSWDFTTTNSTYTSGKAGVYAGSATSGSGTKAIFDSISSDTGWTDNFDDVDYWRLTGSSASVIGNAYPSVPFTSSYLNFTIKHKGGWNGTVRPEIGDKIYISSTAIRSYKGLDSSVGITTNNTNTKYEVWDFEWNPAASNYTVTGSATGAAGTATPGTTYTAPDNKVSLRINSGTPTATKFGDRMLLLQNNYLRNNGAWTGVNGMGSAVLMPPTWTLTGSPIATRYNIEGISGTATARQHGTIDFWFKTNYSGSPATSTSPFGQYLLDYAANGDTDRLFIRHNTNGKLEVAIYAGAAQGTLLQQTFSATAGQWYHLRVAWREAATAFKRAWLDGVAFETNQGTTLGTRGANAGLLRIGNNWQYNGAFDGAIDEFNIFDAELDTSGSCNWGNFDVPTTVWTGGATPANCPSATGANIYRASFDTAMNPQEGWVWADYAYGSPNMIFTNGADTGNERIRVITYPQRTRVWVDNTGEKYTPSARIKYGSGHEENGTAATLAGWAHNFTYHHKAARDSSSAPTYSPVLNLKRSTHIWSDEEISYTGATLVAANIVNQGLGFGVSAVGLAGLSNMNLSHLSMENQYNNFAVTTNPYTSVTPYPSQTISKSVFYNYFDRAYTVVSKTQGSNMVGAYFVTTHVGAANIGTGYNAFTSQNVGIDGSIFMGHRNAYVTVPPAAAGGAATFVSGRLYTVANSEFYNNGVTGAGTSGALNFGVGVAKVNINNNKFSINTNGIRLHGNAFVAMSDNVLDGHVSDGAVTVGAEYGSGIRSHPSYSSVSVTDDGSIYGRGMWNEADISMPPNTTTFEAESLLQFTGVDTQILSPVFFGTQDYNNMSRLGDHYMASTIPGTDIRINYSSSTKDIVNQSTFGNMRTTGAGLIDTTVHTAGGYAWRMEPQSSDVPLEYSAKVIGVANEPLAVTGYIRVNSYYGSSNLPTVTLSGLGMTGANLTWTAANSANEWQQFVVSGTPNESALADLTISSQSSFVVEDEGSSEVIFNPLGNYLPPWVEDVDKSWTPNQWVGYLFKDTYGRIFEVVKNTPTILFLKGIVAPHLKSTTMTNATAGDYQLFRRPYVYLDDVSVLSGTVDTGTLDFFSAGQPVSPWLSTGLTASSIWGAQIGSFADIDGSFGQLLNDRLAVKRGLVSDVAASTTSFVTDLTQATSNFYQNQTVVMMSGQNAGISRRISSYNGTTKAITVDAALPFAPAFNDEFVILSQYTNISSSGGGASAEEIAQAVWEYVDRKLTSATLTSGGALATSAEIAALQADVTYIRNKVDDIYTDTQYISGIVDDILAKWGIYSAADINTSLNTVLTRIGEHTDLSSANTLFGRSKYLQEKWGTQTADTIFNKADDAYNKINSVQTELGYNGQSTTAYQDLQSVLAYVDQMEGYVDTLETLVGSPADLSSADTLFGRIKKNYEAIEALNNLSAQQVWEYGTRTLTGGVTLDDPTQIWDVASALLSNSSSIGKLIVDNLDTTISSRGTSNLTAADVWSAATRTITNIENDGLAALAAAVWANSTRELTAGDLTAQRVWDTLLTSINTIGSIGVLLGTNIDTTISSRASAADLASLQSTLNGLISNLIVAQKAVNDPNPSATEFITTLTNANDDFYNDGVLVFTSGANAGQVRRITNYDGATKTVTVDPALNIEPNSSDTFTILASTANASLDPAAIWTYANRRLTSGNLDVGSLATLSDLESSEAALGAQLDTLINNLIITQKSISDANPSTTSFVTTLTNSTSDFYKDEVLVFTTGANAGQVRRISSYNGATKSLTITPALSNTPTDGDDFTILASTANASLDATAIWAYANRTLTAGTLDSGSLATLSDLQLTETNLTDKINENQTRLDKIISSLIVAEKAVNDASASNVTFITTLASAVDDFYNDGVLVFTSGANAGQVRRITNYDGATKTITVDPVLSLAPGNGDTFTILAATASASASLDAAAVWNYATRRLSDGTLDSGSLATLADLQSTEDNLDLSITAVANAVDLLSDDLISIRSTVNENTTSSTLASFATNLSSSVNDLYNNALITFTTGNNAGVARRIEDYNGTTKILTIEPDLTTPPLHGDGFTILKTLAVPVTKIDTIGTDVAGIKDDVSTIKADIALIKSRLDNIDANIIALETAVDNIEVSSSGSTVNNITRVYEIKPEEMFSSMNSIASSIQNINSTLGRLDNNTLSNILSVAQENTTDLKYVRNKLADFRAVSTVQRQVLDNVAVPVVNTWYTSGSVDLNIMVSNPAQTPQKVPFKIYLPKEAKLEHIMDDGGFNIQYDIQLDTLYASGELELAPGESVKKFIKMRDIWQIPEDETKLAKSQADEFYKKLVKGAYSSQALLLKNDIDTRVEKIVRTQEENIASPQDKIMSYRENKESLAAVKSDLEELKALIAQADSSKGFLGALGGIQTISVWGIIIAFVTGFGLLVAILFSMWKHQMAIASGQMALQSHLMGNKAINSERGSSAKKKKKKTNSKIRQEQVAADSQNQETIKVATNFKTYVKQAFSKLFGKNKVSLLVLLALLLIYFAIRQFNLWSVVAGLNNKPVSENQITTETSSPDWQDKTTANLSADDVNLSFGNEEGALATTSNPSMLATTTVPEESTLYINIKSTPTGWLNVRKSASKTAEILTQVNSGDRFESIEKKSVIGDDYDWYKINFSKDQSGWVYGQYVAEIEG